MHPVWRTLLRRARVHQVGLRLCLHNLVLKSSDHLSASGLYDVTTTAGPILRNNGVILAARMRTVQTKETVRALLDRLPDDCSLDDVLYHLYVIQAIAEGQADSKAGRTMSHQEVAEALRRKWLVDTKK